jgi:lysozyme
MREEGIVGVIHEATYPRFDRDEKYRTRQVAATGAGLLWGAYHFGDATNPVQQANHFLSVVETAWRQTDARFRPSEVLLVLDLEHNGHYPGGTMRPDQAAAFAERIHERTGKYPGVYSNENWLRQLSRNAPGNSSYQRVLSKCWLWIANYHDLPRVSSPWSQWHMWQYTGDGVCGLPRATFPTRLANMRNAERSLFHDGRNTLNVFWKEQGWQPTALPPET